MNTTPSDRPDNNHRHSDYSDAAWTRLDLMAVLALLAVFSGLCVPLLAGTQESGQRVVCANNLRRIGQGFQLWALDHGHLFPWRVPSMEGGSQSQPKTSRAWLEFAYLSNELATPRILVCPSDTGKPRVALDFSRSASGGFLDFNYRDNALSYWIGLDAGVTGSSSFAGPIEMHPRHLVSGDRHIRVSSRNSSCSAGFVGVASVSELSPVSWTNAIHGPIGNILMSDGGVLSVSSAGLREGLFRSDDNGSVHLMIP